MKKLSLILLINLCGYLLSFAQCPAGVNFTNISPLCTGSGVNFTNTSTTGTGALYSYFWDFDVTGNGGVTPATSTVENPTGVIYTLPSSNVGSYNVQLTITEISSSCTKTKTRTININESPIASYTSTAPDCINNTVDFSNTGSSGGGFFNYAWTFGAGATPATSNSQNPTGIKYASSGAKTISFTISSIAGCAANNSTNVINMYDPADASFTTSTNFGCVGQDVNFYDAGSSVELIHNWNFGSGATPATSTLQNPPPVTYSTAGAKYITHDVSNGPNNVGCANNGVTQVISINPVPTASFSFSSQQCTGSVVSFTNTGTTGLGITYAYDFGAGASPAISTAQNPTGIFYATAGTKTVTLTVKNQFGCSSSITSTIIINQTPVANFTSTAPSCTADSVDFLNTGTSGATYAWTFGSGATPATSVTFSPNNVVYATAGIKSVMLITTLGTCTDTSRQTINIKQTPAPIFTSDAPKCQGSAVAFNYTGTTGLGWTYSWDFGTGASPALSLTQTPGTVNYATSGTKNVTLTVTNNGTCPQAVTNTITINQTPVANFTSTAPSCTADSVDFLNTGTSGATYAWTFGSGATPATSITSSPNNVVYATAGIKSVMLITTLGTCTDTSRQTININQTPAPAFTSDAPKCQGSAVAFNYTGTTGLGWTYSWDFGTGASPALSSTQTPGTISYATSGTKNVTLTATNNGTCPQAVTNTITINQTPVANFTSTAPSCTADSVDFLNTGTSGATYAWTFGSGATPATSITFSPNNVVYATAGIKSVMLITTLGTCTDTSRQTINIKQTPAPIFTSDAPKCQGSAVAFNYTGTTGLGWTYSWDFGTGASPALSSTQTPGTVNYATFGTKNVTLTVTNNGTCPQAVTNTITINQTPVANFTSSAPSCTADSVDFLNTGTSGATYAWTFGSGATPATSITFSPNNVVYATAGIKSVMLITTLGTCTDTSRQTININQTPAPVFTSTAPQCKGNAVAFNYTGTTGLGWTYNWDFGTGSSPALSSAQTPPNVMYSTSGTKTISITVTNDICSKTFTGIITINSLPIANAGLDTTICANTSVQIGSSAISGNTYNWFPTSTLNNSTIANPVSSPIAPVTQYVVTVFNTATGCISTDTADVTMLSPLIANSGVDGTICRYDSVQLGIGLIEGQMYSWSPSNGLSSTILPNPVASPSTTTTYTITVTGSGCAAEKDEVTIIVHQLPLINAGIDDTITVGSSTQLIVTGGEQYTWSPSYGLSNIGIYNPIANPDSTTLYAVIGIDIYGCINKDTVMVKVLKPFFWVPTAFTPDGNGENDMFFVRGEGIKNFEFGIFNRWGEQIFYSKNQTQGWDGKLQISGEDLPGGAYVYYVKGVLTSGDPIDAKGMINLIR